MMKSATICYFSPAGSTKKAGYAICDYMETMGFKAEAFNISGRAKEKGSLKESIIESSILIVGSPVYAGNAAEPVLSFLKNIPEGEGKTALAYITYGFVSHGIALYQISRALEEKGYEIKGLAKVPSEHSMMFKCKNPIGKGYPRESDLSALGKWVGNALAVDGKVKLQPFDYREALRLSKINILLNSTFFNPSVMRFFWPSISFNHEKCIGCGACSKACPARRLDDVPVINSSCACFYCYECQKKCPENAFTSNIKYIYPLLRALSKLSSLRGKQKTETYG